MKRWVLPYGNLSPASGLKVDDQLKLYAAKRYRPIRIGKSQVEAHLLLREALP